MKRFVLFFVLTLFLFSSGTVFGDTFDDITVDYIMSTLLSSDAINGSEGDENQLPAGAILLYRTDAGRYGKLEITAPGYNLDFKFVTYGLQDEDEPEVYHFCDNAYVAGTWTFDLDEDTTAAPPIILPIDLTGDDFHWNQLDMLTGARELVPYNGAEFTVYPGTPVPIPSAFLLFTSSLIGIAGLRKRFRK